MLKQFDILNPIQFSLFMIVLFLASLFESGYEFAILAVMIISLFWLPIKFFVQSAYFYLVPYILFIAYFFYRDIEILVFLGLSYISIIAVMTKLAARF